MVFSINTLNESYNKPFPTLIQEQDNDNFSFFLSTLENIMLEEREFEINMIHLNEGIIGNIVKKNIDKKIDNIKSIDIKELLSKILDWFIDKISNMEAFFYSFMLTLLNKETQIKLFKKKLVSYDKPVKIRRKYYEYTNIVDNSNFASYKNDISKEYDSFISDMYSVKNAHTPMEKANLISNIKEQCEYSSEKLNLLRGKIVGKSNGVSADDFAGELFKYFRNGKDSPISGKNTSISADMVKEAYEGFFNYKKIESIIKRESHKLKGEARTQKAKIATYITDYISVTDVNSSIIKDYSYIVNQKCRTIKEICNIYTLLYSSKLDALKEFNVRNKAILSAAVTQILFDEEEENKNDK